MLPELLTSIPGSQSLQKARELREYESHNVTYVSDTWPIFWDRAEGVNVWDVDGNRYLDMTSAFGVCGLGHRNEAVVAAMHAQSDLLLHGMGDVHPTPLKAQLCKKLSEVTFERWSAGKAKTILTNSGFEAVEAALKTAFIATKRAGIICFRNGYHGLGYGALLGSSYDKFRDPFASQLLDVREVLNFPKSESDLEGVIDCLNKIDPSKIGAVLVEPIQGRGGKIIPPVGFLKALRDWCDAHGAMLIFDEIYTGFNRTGKMFACEWDEIVPDVICVGKAMSSGFPISACIGKARVMDAWPVSPGEALHTSTFLGHPVGCAMSLAAIAQHESDALREKITHIGDYIIQSLQRLHSPKIKQVRGRGLMIGAELDFNAGELLDKMLQQGIIMLCDGPEGNVLAFTPPFDLSESEVDFVIQHLSAYL